MVTPTAQLAAPCYRCGAGIRETCHDQGTTRPTPHRERGQYGAWTIKRGRWPSTHTTHLHPLPAAPRTRRHAPTRPTA